MLTVQQGSIHVNYAWVAARSSNTIIIEADLRAKYAEIYALSGCEIMIGRGEHTLHSVDDNRPTSVKLDLPPGWEIDASISRYILRIYAFKRDPGATVLWSDDDAAKGNTP